MKLTAVPKLPLKVTFKKTNFQLSSILNTALFWGVFVY